MQQYSQHVVIMLLRKKSLGLAYQRWSLLDHKRANLKLEISCDLFGDHNHDQYLVSNGDPSGDHNHDQHLVSNVDLSGDYYHDQHLVPNIIINILPICTAQNINI